MAAPWLNELVSLVSKEAPLLGSVLGGPFGGVAGSLIAEAFGQGSSVDILSKVSSDPDAAAKLKDIEDKHIEVLKKLSVDDLVSARAMPVRGWEREIVIGLLVFLLMFCIVAMQIVTDVKLDHFLLVAITVLLVELRQAFKLYFGG